MAAEANTALKLRVEGMDCGACAIKIENGLKRLPGVTDINVNYGLETLSLVLDEDRTSRGSVEERIRSLGYTPRSMPGEGANAGKASTGESEVAGRAWWQTRKGQFVIGTGILLGLALSVRPGTS